MKKVIVWFRQDLRLHDNEALTEALAVADELLPVYVFDPRLFQGETRYGFDRVSAARARFILESVEDLRNRLAARGAQLVIRTGHPEDVIFDLARQYKSSWVFCNRERTRDEVSVQDKLERNLWSIGQEVRFSRGKMLYYTADLPFPVTHTPDNYSIFRKETERIISIRTPLDDPDMLPGADVEGIDCGKVPSLSELTGSAMESMDAVCKGGEAAALEQLNTLIIRGEGPARDMQDGISGEPRFSPWISQGCLSPKTLYFSIVNSGIASTEYGSQMIQALGYRDYLRLMVKKHGSVLFQSGFQSGEDAQHAKGEMDRFNIWAQAKTGIPIIDAAMRQLNSTGFVSFHLRNLLANFLIYELDVPWQVGASYYESKLIDYDPCSNWVSWCNMAGVGPVPHDSRKLNFVMLARRFDPHGEYVKRWIPALANAKSDWVHQPDQAEDAQRAEANLVLGKDYPRPIFGTERWL